MSKIETLVKDMKAYLSGENPAKLTDDAKEVIIQSYAKEMKMAWDRSFNGEPQPRRLRMSNWGKCKRELWYEEHADGRLIEKLDPTLLYMFSYGHVVELQTLMLVELAGHTVECPQWDLEIGGISGHCDAIIDGYMFDVKSTNDYSFKKFQNGLDPYDDLFGYMHQLNGYYAAALQDQSVRPLLNLDPRIGFLAVNKATGDFCIDMHRPWPVEKTLKEAIRTREITQSATTPDRLPTKMKGTSDILGVQCAYCSWKYECWKDVDLTVVEYDNKYTGKKSKTYFTKIGAPLKTPAVDKEQFYEQYITPSNDTPEG